MQHIIKKQVIELKLNKDHNAFRMQHLISDHYRNEMVPVLETVFNEYCGEDEVLILDKLEIDFGTISERDLEKTRWDDDFIAKFKVRLRESLAVLAGGKTPLRESMSMNSCRQWIFYMQHGYLNWNTLTINELWYNKVLETLAVDYTAITTLRNLVLSKKSMAARIASQHDDIFLTKLIEILTAQNQKNLSAAIEEIYLVLKSIKGYQKQEFIAAGAFKKEVWQQVITISAAKAKDVSTGGFITMILNDRIDEVTIPKRRQTVLLSQVTVIKKILGNLFESQNSNKKAKDLPVKEKGIRGKDKDKNIDESTEKTVPTGAGDEVAEDKKKAAGTEMETDKAPNAKKAGKQNQDDDITGLDVAGAIKKEDKTSSDTRDKVETLPSKNEFTGKKETADSQLLREQIPSEGIFIHHAGIVLVHPFLGHLFRRLQLVEDNRFTDAGTQLKAVFLLHYLATGKTVADEYELILCKLLCAYPVDEPLPAEMIFTDAELDEANEMLTATIQQWSKLQNTSVDGLREGFLQRGGKLFIKNNSPYVQVESSAIDVLLDYLPWNLSMIKLPWMKEMLRVEWR